jgi:hypothetical protein
MKSTIIGIRQAFRRFSRSSFFIPALLFILAFLSYGVLIPQLGFYWDDLPYLFLSHSQGIAGYPAYMSFDRPFSAGFFMLEVTLFGSYPLGYHIFALLLRWACATALFLILERILIRNRQANFLAAAIFLVYPGFLQQPIALIYSLHFAALFLFLLSILFMLLSIEKDNHRFIYTMAGLIASFGLFASEYFALLELVRPIVLCLYFRKKNILKENIFFSIINFWIPYLIVFCLFLIWRVFIFKFPTYSLNLFSKVAGNAVPAIIQLITRVLRDLYTVTTLVWFKSFDLSFITQLNSIQFLSWLAIMVCTFLILNWSFRIAFEDQSSSRRSRKAITYLGVILIFLAGLAIWITDLPIELQFAWDRLTLPFSLGIGCLVAGVWMKFFNKKNNLRNLIACLLISISAGHHYLNSLAFRSDWEYFNEFFQQLSIRAPDLKQGTTILTNQFGLKYYSDNSLAAPLNWYYDDNNHSLNLNYMFYFLNVRLNRGLPALNKDLAINQTYRSFSFTGSTNNLLYLEYQPPSCLHILDQYSFMIFRQKIPEQTQKAIDLSNLDLIDPHGNHRFPAFFLPGMGKNWCYYFEKADLAKQFSDWKYIVELGKEAFGSGLKSFDPNEYFPFIEAHAHESDLDSAIQLTRAALQLSPEIRPQLCRLWSGLLNNILYDKLSDSVSQLFYSDLQCFQ